MYFAPPVSHSAVCPRCGSSYISKSRRRGLIDFLFHTLLFTDPYRCMDCDFRFYRLFSIFLHGITSTSRIAKNHD
jgi:DNA-directed RNA polymerase subunit RPC12/RpoP